MGINHECDESPQWLPEHSFILHNNHCSFIHSSQQPREQVEWLVHAKEEALNLFIFIPNQIKFALRRQLLQCY